MPKRLKNRAARRLMLLLLIAAAAALIAGILLIVTRLRRDSELRTAQQYPPVATETAPAVAATLPPETVPVLETESEAPTEPTRRPGAVTDITLSFYQAYMAVGDGSILPIVTMLPEDADDRSERWTSSDETVATVDESGRITPVGVGSCTVRVSSVSDPDVSAEVSVIVEETPSVMTTPPMSTPGHTTFTAAAGTPRDDIVVINGITYVQGGMMVNKTYPLPASYDPGGLTPETAAAFAEMQQAARDEAGLTLFSHSDYRPYYRQSALYDSYCARDGQAAADRFSARPGYSEHQTGMVIDVNWPGDSFNGTPEAEWMAENAHRFGFVIRFPQDKEEVTGYKYESWHIRYVGREWAAQIYESGLCLEEFFDVTSQYPE